MRATLVSLGLSIVSFVALCCLPARSVDLRRADIGEAEQAPAAHSFSISDITWDVDGYQKDPRLNPLREFFQARCSDPGGMKSAQCLAELFAAAYCHGPPHADSFALRYDPVADLQSHLRGEPGNCVTRTALISAILLANGVPARQVQYITPQMGHTAVEVWDAENGWVYFDPTFGGVFSDGRHFLSAPAALVRAEGSFLHASSPASSDVFDQIRGNSVTLRYPEPWLYTRTGHHYARWPFRSASIEVGAWN